MTVGLHIPSRPNVPQHSTLCYGVSVIHNWYIDIFINWNWVVTRWQ